MVRHTAAVRRGAPNSFIIGDMPYMSYHLNLEQTKINAARLMVEGGANAVNWKVALNQGLKLSLLSWIAKFPFVHILA
jgi:3-methyl-2-oxobutanoate hydroxymethyltransferase